MAVVAENDATAAAFGEQLYGAGRGLRTFVYIYIGFGLGSGLVLDGRPFRGATGKAGELGHAVVVPGGRPCGCGSHGCLERYVSMEAALRAIGAPDQDGRARLADALDGEDPRLLVWLDEASGHLKIAIAMLENVLEPETIVVGGTLPTNLADALIARLGQLLPSVSASGPRAMPRLTRAQIDLETATLGAAALPLFRSLAPHLDLVR